MTTQTFTTNFNLFERFQALLADQPKRRARDLAQELNVSEGALVACRQGHDVWQLQASFTELLKQLAAIGEVMTITRNDEAVHERHGIYRKLSFAGNGAMGLVLSEDLDLRLFMNQWHSAFHVIENGRESIQFFDVFGTAVHKVYQTDKSDRIIWDSILNNAKMTKPTPVVFQQAPTKSLLSHQAPNGFAREQFQQDWAALTDVHEYHGMLKKHGLSRTQALANIDAEWAVRLNPSSVVSLLESAQQQACDIMIFVGNSGCIQIYTGTIHKLVPHGPWFNILDPEFNLHLRPDLISETWLIRRPSADGVITSIECFNQYGDSIMTVFGKRKPGLPELPLWREMVENLALSEAHHEV